MYSITLERVGAFCTAMCAIPDGVSGGESWHTGSASSGVMALLSVLTQIELTTRVAESLKVKSLRKQPKCFEKSI